MTSGVLDELDEAFDAVHAGDDGHRFQRTHTIYFAANFSCVSPRLSLMRVIGLDH